MTHTAHAPLAAHTVDALGAGASGHPPGLFIVAIIVVAIMVVVLVRRRTRNRHHDDE